MSPRVVLLEGVVRAAEGRRAEALDALERAAVLATEARFSLEAGLAHEGVARVYEAGGHAVPALAHLRVARQVWIAWGASACATRLERTHPGVVLAAEPSQPIAQTIAAGVTTTSGGVERLDLLSVFKITQAISSEIVFERLLARMLELSCEGAGARRGVMLLSDRGVLRVAAEHRTDRPEADRTRVVSIPMAELPELAASVVLLAARAREIVLISDSDRAGVFASDPWIASGRARSVLAIPVVHQGQTRGVLYLEHDETPCVFTEDRTQLMSLLSGQIASALENALLYRDAERMAQSFSRFVPTEFLHHLGRRSILDVELGDAVQREMTVLFADIRDFTARTEGMSPSEAFRFVNAYLRRVGPVVRRHGGFIDKYIGDAVMALFPRGPEDAVQAAVALHRAVEALNREELAGQAPVRIGVGLHVGPLVLGTIGEERRIDSTVIADAVNVASRLESMTKTFGAGALISGDVLRGLPPGHRAVAVRRLGAYRFRGKAVPLDVYELLDALAPAVRELRLATRPLIERAVRAVTAGDRGEAETILAEVEALDPTDRAPSALRAALTGSADTPRS
jgi:class 3 adenylate cyclase